MSTLPTPARLLLKLIGLAKMIFQVVVYNSLGCLLNRSEEYDTADWSGNDAIWNEMQKSSWLICPGDTIKFEVIES